MLFKTDVHPDAPSTLRPIFDRYSCRAFAPDPIPDEHLHWLKEALRWAPSAGNYQPWYFFVIYDERTKRDLARAALNQTFLTEAPLVFVVCSEPDRSARGYGERGATLYHLQDTAAAIENLLIAATALGYGSCWIGAFSESAVSQILNLDPSLRPMALVPVGVPRHPPGRRTGRRPSRELFTTMP